MTPIDRPIRPRRRTPSATPGRWLCAALVLALVLAVAPGCGGRRPGGPGVIHHVARGENLYRIGMRYGIPPNEIARINGIADVTELRVGQRLYIPGQRTRRAAVAAKRAPAQPPLSGNTAEARRLAQNSARSAGPLKFNWPVRGELSSKFGRRWGRNHEGIDISARSGTPIFAAEAGRVVASGRQGGYGNAVVVKHAGRYKTLYAHASKLLVRKGQFVERGQKIALVGSTGRSTAPHLHFEIIRGTTKQNPLGYLP